MEKRDANSFKISREIKTLGEQQQQLIVKITIKGKQGKKTEIKSLTTNFLLLKLQQLLQFINKKKKKNIKKYKKIKKKIKKK